jgi:hypothetical protein
VSNEKKARANVEDAWVRRNSVQVGPLRIGEGSMVCWRRMVPDAGGSQDDAHSGWLTLNSAVTSGGILTGQSENEADGASGDARAPRSVGLGPFATNQFSMPPGQGLGSDQEPSRGLRSNGRLTVANSARSAGRSAGRSTWRRETATS